MSFVVHQLFRAELRRHRVTVSEAPALDRPATLIVLPWGARLLLRAGLQQVAQLEAAAVQLGRLEHGHDLVDVDPADRRRARRERWQAEAWAARRLIPDRCMELAHQLGLDPRDVARDVGVSDRLAAVRYAAWTAQMAVVVAFPAAMPPM